MYALSKNYLELRLKLAREKDTMAEALITSESFLRPILLLLLLWLHLLFVNPSVLVLVYVSTPNEVPALLVRSNSERCFHYKTVSISSPKAILMDIINVELTNAESSSFIYIINKNERDELIFKGLLSLNDGNV